MQEWGWEVGPEEVHEEGERGEKVEDEAVVLVGRNLGRRAGDGFEFIGGAVGGRWSGGPEERSQ